MSRTTGIRLLWRQPDTMALFGIPYGMRAGQQPRDLLPTIRDVRIVKGKKVEGMVIGTRWGQTPADWVYLGSPGWWGSIPLEEQEEIGAFLFEIEKVSPGMVPGGPAEWCDLADVHPLAGGDLCQDVSGTCRICQVELSTCHDCEGIGYHRALCPVSEGT